MPNDHNDNSLNILQAAERRQLTVMFVDIVGSTAHANRSDPEDFFEFIVEYQNTIKRCVAEYQGYVARFVGDGVLVFFGWPNAQEDDAIRAIRAAKKIVKSVTDIQDPDGNSVMCRVGIATGMMVVGEIANTGQYRQNEVFGDVPNLADHLQSLAAAGEIIVSSKTRNLGGKEFEFKPINNTKSSNNAAGQIGYIVKEEKSVARRFIPVDGSSNRKTFGRQRELERVEKLWKMVKEKKGQVCAVSGDAGVGKSHLVHEFYRTVKSDNTPLAIYQCSRFHMQSPYYFLIKRIESWAGIDIADSSDIRMDKLEFSLGTKVSAAARNVMIGLFTTSDSLEKRGIVLDARHHEIIQKSMYEMLISYIGDVPTVVIFDDLHWADPSSIDVVRYVCENIADHPILALATYRPEIDFFNGMRSNHHLFEVEPLSKQATALMVEEIAGENTLDRKTCNRIVEKTDGVPLFVESYTKAVVDAILVNHEDSTFRGMVDVPMNLHDSLMERLDVLGDAKSIAQLCSAIGRRFNASFVHKLSDRSLDDIERCLEKLSQAGILETQQSRHEASYRFRHSLIQDAAYQGLLRRRRRQLHRDIAQTFISERPEMVKSEPGFVAEHFRAAESYGDALHYLLKAAKKNVVQFANHEAMENADQGIVLVRRLGEPAERGKIELEFQLVKARASSAAFGFAGDATTSAFKRILDLASKTKKTAYVIRAMRGLFNGLNVEGRYDDAIEMAQKLVDNAAGDAHALMIAHHMGCVPLIWKGEFVAALAQINLAIEQHQKYKLENSEARDEPPAQIKATLGIIQAYLGKTDQAKANCLGALKIAKTNGTPLDNANCYLGLCNVLRITRDSDAARYANEFFNFVKDMELPYYSASVLAFVGLAKIEDGKLTEGSQQLKQGWQQFTETKSRLNQVFYLCELANCDLKSGKYDSAMRTINQGFAISQEFGEHNFDAELSRILAELMNVTGQCETDEIVAKFNSAINRAKSQKAFLFEIRARNGLANYYIRKNRNLDALRTINSIAGLADNNIDNRDLRITREIISQIDEEAKCS